MQAVFGRQKGDHGPRRSMRGPWKLGDESSLFVGAVFCEEFLARIEPYTVMSHTKMLIVFGRGRSTNYSA